MATATLWGWQSSLITNGIAGLVTIGGSWLIYKGYDVEPWDCGRLRKKVILMSNIGDKRNCPACHQFVAVMELIPNKNRGEGWYIQKLSCGHTGNINIMDI